MKRFDFPLEKVRSWRDEQAALEELRLQQVRAELAAIESRRKAAEVELETAERNIRQSQTVESLDLSNLDSFRLFTRALVQKIDQDQRQCETRVVEQRQRVMEARRQFELLNRLRKKALADWTVSRDKEQEELAAELFLARRKRNTAE